MNEKETSRLEAFSDGVFAIAITLLILEIKMPHVASAAGPADFFRTLLTLWPSFVAFVASFSAILIIWVNHHGIFRPIHVCNSRLLFANGFLLLLVTFVPFPTAVLAEHLGGGAENSAAAFYCGTYAALCLSCNLLWFVATGPPRLLRRNVSEQLVEKIRKAYLYALPVYVVATVLALINAWAGLALSTILWILWARLDYRSPEASG